MTKINKCLFITGFMIAFLLGFYNVYHTWHIGNQNGGIFLPEGYIFSFLDFFLDIIILFFIIISISNLFYLIKKILQTFKRHQSKPEWVSFSLDFCAVILSALAVLAAILACFYIRSQGFVINTVSNDHCTLIQGLDLSQPNKDFLCWAVVNLIFYNFIAFLIFLILMQLPIWGVYFYLRKKFQNMLSLNDKEYNSRHLEIGRKNLKWMIIYLSLGIFFIVHIYVWASIKGHNPQGEWCDYVEKSAPYHIYIMGDPCVLQWDAMGIYLLVLGMFIIPIILPLLLYYFGVKLLIYKSKV